MYIRSYFYIFPYFSHIFTKISIHSHGWDQVTQGLVELGFTLMDSFGPKMVFGKVKVHDNNTPITPSQKACHLGAKLLLKTFKVTIKRLT